MIDAPTRVPAPDVRTDGALPVERSEASTPRPATGFFAHLTDCQKARALAYRGDENHGDEAFLPPERVAP